MDKKSSQPTESSLPEEKPSNKDSEALQAEAPEKKDISKDVLLPRFRQDDPSYMDSPHVPVDNIILGVILIIASVSILFYNELTAIGRKDFLQKNVDTILTLPLDKVDYRNGGKIVHVVGVLETKDVLQDAVFGAIANAIKLKREVEMYQWTETCTTKEKTGEYDAYGLVKTETTCLYDKTWADKIIYSHRFYEPVDHENPLSFSFPSRTWAAKNVKVGVFKLWPQLVDRMEDYEPYSLSSLKYMNLPKNFKSEVHFDNGAVYLGKSPLAPHIGDMRVRYKIIRPFKMVTIIARQAADSLALFEGKQGELSSKFLSGTFSPQDIFYSRSLKDKKVWFIWWVRVIVFVLLFAGLHLSLCPLRVIAYYIPFLRQFLGADFGSVIFSFSFLLYFLVLGFSWYPQNIDLARVFLGISLVPILFCRLLAGSRK